MDDLLSEFLTETSENLAIVDAELVELERNPSDKTILGSIFRLVHTIKGTCGFLGLPRLEAIAHAGESVLGKLRDGSLPVTPKAVTGVLKCIDTIRDLLAELEARGGEPAGDDAVIIAELNALAEGKDGSEPTTTASAQAVASTQGSAAAIEIPSGQDLSSPFPVADELLAEVEAAVASGARAATEAELALSMQAERAQEHANGPEARDTGDAGATGGEQVGTAREPAIVSQSIRVAVDTLDALMTLVSELVLTRNQLLQIARGRKESDFSAPLQRLSHITTELQEGVMKTRMQPIGNAWAKLPRIVRDLAQESGKKIELQMLGSETEVDRQVLELIKDPLTHMVRNSADHGIEAPNERRRAGKAEIGTISLSARHEGGHIIIEISDDGKGLDHERIRRKAISLGVISEAEAAAMSEQQLYQCIFRPGFSTADKVTTVSGRGVGMDVVRTNVDRIGGSIDLRSSAGLGSTFVIRIPLTLAIVSALIVSCGGHRFALPQACVLELVRAGTSETRIERINSSLLLRLRERLLPVVELGRLLRFGDESRSNGSERGCANLRECLVIVAQVGAKRFGIVVDEVFDTEEIVVKPVAPMLRDIPVYAGNTILGDGGVIMILDPNGLAATIDHETCSTDNTALRASDGQEEKTRLLVFRTGEGDARKAVPLELVARLEEIDASRIEHAQARAMLQYRGRLMPLVPCTPGTEWPSEGPVQVLVFNDRDRCMGLVVEEIVDIVEDHLNVEVKSLCDGLIGSAIIDGKATDVIDAAPYLTAAFPDWFDTTVGQSFGETTTVRHVLLVDDSPFFRNLLVPMLEAAGYGVTAVGNATEALRLRDSGRSFDAIISDIEMPGMSGFDFAARVREEGPWKDVPLVALSSFTSDSDFQRGHACGFSDYVAKADREGLMQSLANTFVQPRAA
ncbi:MAG: hybrid sensor histidine kinase/response regulator [Rhodospirillales bacterium]